MGPDHVIRWTVDEVESTGSTNADLLAALDGEEPPPDHSVLRTDHQTAGRGRLDRRWDAPPGSNLLVSILFRNPPSPPHLVTQAVGLAAVRTVDDLLSGADGPPDDIPVVSLKWPNDVLLGDRKLAGVLAQRHASGPVVVGTGLNVGWAPDGAASLEQVVDAPPPAEFLDALLAHLGELVVRLEHDPDAHHREVIERTSTIGTRVRVELPGGRLLVGRALDIDRDGRVLVDDGTAHHLVDVGDIVHLRTEPPS